MDYNIDANEEIILLAMQDALSENLTEIINRINNEKKEVWLSPLNSVNIGEKDITYDYHPSAVITIKKGHIKTEDSIIKRCEYIFNLRITLNERQEKFSAYRYASAIGILIKENTLLPATADSIILEELDYYLSKDRGSGENNEAEFKIRFIREGF